MRPSVQIKGIREGLLIILGEGEWQQAQEALLEEVERQADFLRGGNIILEVGERALNAATLGKLRDTLSDLGLSFWGVLSTSPNTEQNAQALGLATRIHQAERSETEPAQESAANDVEALLVRRTLRSGTRLEHPGHITVVGDVNPGAEIIAGGDIVVWGRLRGMVHAGAEGDESAVVCALDLSPTQLRIAGRIAISPKQNRKPQPEMAAIRGNQVVAENWTPSGK